MKIDKELVIIVGVLLLIVAGFGIALWVQTDFYWSKIHDLEQSPDICWKCGLDIDAVAAEKDAAIIDALFPK